MKANRETDTLQPQKAPYVIRVYVPNSSTSVKLKVIIKNNVANKIWSIVDMVLFGESASVDCAANTLEGLTGENKEFCASASVILFETAVSGYSYVWLPAAGLSSATVANPISPQLLLLYILTP